MTDQSRSEFEAWYASRQFSTTYDAWQASRQAALEEAAQLCEEESRRFDDDRDGGMYRDRWGRWMDWKDGAEAIRSLAQTKALEG